METASEKQILREAMKRRGVNQTDVAKRIGITQGALSINMRRERMSMDVFRNVLSALRYDIVITDRDSGNTEWMLEG